MKITSLLLILISACFCLNAPAQKLNNEPLRIAAEAPNDAEQKKQQPSSDDNFTVVEGTVRIVPPVIEDAPLVPGTCDLGGVVEVEATGGTNAAYATLGAAFAAINAGTHTGTITIDVCGDTTENGFGDVKRERFGRGFLYVNRHCSGGRRGTDDFGNLALPLIDFNGADNVTIDGVNANGNALTISNTNAGAVSTTSTIRFIGGATSNTITRASILGSFSGALATNGGNIFFSTDANTTDGNDNNTISNNNIGPAGTNLPTKLIYGNGSATTAAIRNSGIVISNNNLFDYFSATTSVSGMHILSGNDNWNIVNNRIYQTAARTFTGTVLRYAGITIELDDDRTSGRVYLDRK